MDKRNINGQQWIRSAGGDWVPAANFPTVKIQNSEIVESLVRQAQVESDRLAAFKKRAYGELYTQIIKMGEEFKAVLADDKGVTFTSICQQYQVVISYSTSLVPDERVHFAKQRMTEIISQELSANTAISGFLQRLLVSAFDTDKQGRMDTKRLFDLANTPAPEVDGWDEACELLLDSMSNVKGKKYIRFYSRNAEGKWQIIPLQFSDL